MSKKTVPPDELRSEIILWKSTGKMSDRLTILMLEICRVTMMLPQFNKNNDDTRQEMIQEAFVQIIKAKDKISENYPGNRMFGYLQMIIKNAYFQLHRSRQQNQRNFEKYTQYVKNNCTRLH